MCIRFWKKSCLLMVYFCYVSLNCLCVVKNSFVCLSVRFFW